MGAERRRAERKEFLKETRLIYQNVPFWPQNGISLGQAEPQLKAI